MRVPKSFNEVTVEQFQRLNPVYQKTLTEEDSIKYVSLWAEIIAVLTDKKTSEIEAALSTEKILSIARELKWLGQIPSGLPNPFLLFKGKLYRARLNAKKITPGQYVDIKTFMGRGGAVKNLHILLACIYVPLSSKGFEYDGETHEERAEIFKKAKVGKVVPTVFFYSRALKRSIKRIQDYGLRLQKENLKEADELLMQTLSEILEEIGDGTSPLTNSPEETHSKKKSYSSGAL